MQRSVFRWFKRRTTAEWDHLNDEIRRDFGSLASLGSRGSFGFLVLLVNPSSVSHQGPWSGTTFGLQLHLHKARAH